MSFAAKIIIIHDARRIFTENPQSLTSQSGHRAVNLKQVKGAIVKPTRLIVGLTLSLSLPVMSTSGATADTTSNFTSSSYADQLAAYKVAMANYKIAMDQYNEAWKKSLASYKDAVNTALKDAKMALQNLRDKRKMIAQNFKISVQQANKTFTITMRTAKTADQKSAAINARIVAINDATAARNVALDALSRESATAVKPIPPVKPAPPTKPTAPEKSATPRNSPVVKKGKKTN